MNTNRYITRFYIFYQALILCLSFISIAVTAMTLWEALDLALSDSMSSIYTGVIIILPIIFFVFVCFKYESNTQLFWAFIFRMVTDNDRRQFFQDGLDPWTRVYLISFWQPIKFDLLSYNGCHDHCYCSWSWSLSNEFDTCISAFYLEHSYYCWFRN